MSFLWDWVSGVLNYLGKCSRHAYNSMIPAMLCCLGTATDLLDVTKQHV